ncbi:MULTISPECIES: universal stress protein [unclassified Cellulophaga]|uniref:universal stress protein n=1 Tax=unclassified Cellulophaga TaxID=2634405 RepID=UPI000C2BBBA8|nr:MULTISPECIES: universal stress protein [unclassified Cellulophaga]MDO6491250.1 universal stress protein [Cellulophaga sp. 2_MG-2023]MDO6495217.1 universal stress protein [Cellulophaga sp. 3_MG-2023]PKB42793.1 nucleotide-binding universal stress UspA family protein [Cellulophaga sp. RHA19]
MLKKKYKILVLSDLKETTVATLQSTVNLAKTINGDVSFFYAKKASDVVVRDNQLSAMRSINEQYNSTDHIISNIIKPISKASNTKIKHSFSFGNVKNEIAKQIEEQQPDVIVLGKRKSKMINIIGDHITDFVLKNYKGLVLITTKNGEVTPVNSLTLGVLNEKKEFFNLKFIEDLIKNSQKTITPLTVAEKGNKEQAILDSKEAIDFVPEQGGNEISYISKYLLKSNINLLCVNRATKGVRNVINKADVSLLLYTNK